jgi:uncharacterized protein (TIGR03067 family)
VEAEAKGKRSSLDAIWSVQKGEIVLKDHPTDSPDEWGYSVNLATTPRQIDFRPTTGPAKGKTLKGVYVIEKDRLTVCYVSPRTDDPEKQPRPTNVEPGPDRVVLRFKR